MDDYTSSQCYFGAVFTQASVNPYGGCSINIDSVSKYLLGCEAASQGALCSLDRFTSNTNSPICHTK